MVFATPQHRDQKKSKLRSIKQSEASWNILFRSVYDGCWHALLCFMFKILLRLKKANLSKQGGISDHVTKN